MHMLPSRFETGQLSLRAMLVMAFDVLAVLGCWAFSYALRFNFSVPGEFAASGLQAALWVLPVHALMFWLFGLYKGIWIFASLPDLIRIVRAVASAAILTMLLVFLFRATPAVPRSVFILHPFLLIVVMGGARVAYRAWKEHQRWGALVAAGKPVILLGAGAAGMQMARELCRSAEWRLVGVLDDDPSKIGRELFGFRVLGGLSELGTVAAELKARHAIIAMPSAGAQVHKRAMTACVQAGVKAMVLPSWEGMIKQGDAATSLRELDVEDLLGREPVQIDTGNVGHMLTGRTVLVTGAGGSIGSELCRQIVRFRPASLIAYELNEYALYRLTEEFAEHFPGIQVIPVAGDVRDAAWLQDVFRRFVPSVVFHAAAYKHVPLMEDANAWQAMRNNVLGTWCVAQAALAHGADRMVLISTDKAVNPTNVMGASKRLAEMMCLAAQLGSSHTRFECVRFGNVLGSVGSVVPKFREQIARGGPVTVTHPEITRYFMSIPEAAQLVLQAGAMGEGGDIFVMDMGKPVKIVDLARDMIRLSGATEHEIRIEFTGLRPGEKLYEELLADSEQTRETHHPKLRIAKARKVDPALVDEIIAWLRSGQVRSPGEVKRELRRWVPEYAPTSQRVDLQIVGGAKNRA